MQVHPCLACTARGPSHPPVPVLDRSRLASSLGRSSPPRISSRIAPAMMNSILSTWQYRAHSTVVLYIRPLATVRPNLILTNDSTNILDSNFILIPHTRSYATTTSTINPSSQLPQNRQSCPSLAPQPDVMTACNASSGMSCRVSHDTHESCPLCP